MFEAVVSLLLQANAFFFHAVDVKCSLMVGLLSMVKAAIGFDLIEHRTLVITLLQGTGDHAQDADVPLVTGPLPSLLAFPARTFILSMHRALEIVSGVGCIVVFHVVAHDAFTISLFSREFSVAGPFFISMQVLGFAMMKDEITINSVEDVC